mmetsp:Transcript_74961/g.103974  ORF Transcript_74961/g.103974 Transcript_74961/m.103974 type:complete len:257 (-) Transcript_74961:154-924(-)
MKRRWERYRRHRKCALHSRVHHTLAAHETPPIELALAFGLAPLLALTLACAIAKGGPVNLHGARVRERLGRIQITRQEVPERLNLQHIGQQVAELLLCLGHQAGGRYPNELVYLLDILFDAHRQYPEILRRPSLLLRCGEALREVSHDVLRNLDDEQRKLAHRIPDHEAALHHPVQGFMARRPVDLVHRLQEAPYGGGLYRALLTRHPLSTEQVPSNGVVGLRERVPWPLFRQQQLYTALGAAIRQDASSRVVLGV